MTSGRDILTHTITIDVPDGTSMGAFVARPDTPATFPGVIVGMELFGVSAHVRDVCERLAAEGFVALAPHLYHRSAAHVELPEDDTGRTRGFELLHKLTRSDALLDVQATRDRLQADGSSRVGMLGLSVGGHVAYLAATTYDLPAVAVCYGGWIPTTDIPLSRPEPTLAGTPSIRGHLLMVVGNQDQVVTTDHVDRIGATLDAANVNHELVVYPDVGHGFLSNRRATYDPDAAADAWQRILTLFASELSR